MIPLVASRPRPWTATTAWDVASMVDARCRENCDVASAIRSSIVVAFIVIVA
jgi:hypothetical protein